MFISAIFRTFVSVKETVTDIADVLKSMNEKLGSMQKTIDSQHDTICNLNRSINRLNAEVSKRNAIIEDLKKRLAKYETPDKNSNNSSTPPSKEKMKDEVVRRTKTLRTTSGRKPGGQAGHKGSADDDLKRILAEVFLTDKENSIYKDTMNLDNPDISKDNRNVIDKVRHCIVSGVGQNKEDNGTALALINGIPTYYQNSRDYRSDMSKFKSLTEGEAKLKTQKAFDLVNQLE